MRRLWMAALVFAVAGCSTTTVPGTPAEKVLTKAELYDPSTLPAASLIAVGLNPKPIDTDFFGLPDPEWHLCLWNAQAFGITVLSTTNTFREVKENPRNQDLRPLAVTHRNAVTYYDVSDPSRDVCDVAFATPTCVRCSSKPAPLTGQARTTTSPEFLPLDPRPEVQLVGSISVIR